MRVAIILSPDGGFQVISDEHCVVYTIDESAPHDRVYQLSHVVDAAALDQLIGNSDIGHAEDDRHAAIANRINSHLDGKPHLRPVE